MFFCSLKYELDRAREKKTYALDKYFNMILWKFDPLSKNVFFLNHYIHVPLDQTHLLEARQTIATFFSS